VTNTRASGSAGIIVGLWEHGVDHVRAFANFRDTFKPAAFDFGLVENEGILKPETSRSVEGGVKIRTMNGRFDLEASGFRMNFANLVTSTVVDGLPALINSGKTRFQGFEIASDVRLPRAVSGRITYSFHDGTFVDFVQLFDDVPTQLAGKRVEMSARQLVSGGLTLAPERGVIATVNVNFTGQRFLNMRNTAPAAGFTTVDAGAGYRLSRVELRVDARNLGNRRDPVAESEFGDAQYYLMTARTVAASLVVKF
jgi:iron complex outermembrane receptor protein